MAKLLSVLLVLGVGAAQSSRSMRQIDADREREAMAYSKRWSGGCAGQGEYYAQVKRWDHHGHWGMDLVHDLMKGKYECRKGMEGAKTAVIDVGANIGQDNHLFVQEFSAPCWGRPTVFLFEPNVKLLDILRKSIVKANALRGANVKFELINAAASDKNGTIHFNGNSKASWGTVSETPHKRSVSVPSMRLDEFVKSRGIKRIPLLKTDAEGFDPQVLKGVEGIFPIVEVIFWECHRKMDGYGYNLRDTVNYLEGHGFVTYLMGRWHSLLLNDPHWSPEFEKKQFQNCLSIPKGSKFNTHHYIPSPCNKGENSAGVVEGGGPPIRDTTELEGEVSLNGLTPKEMQTLKALLKKVRS